MQQDSTPLSGLDRLDHVRAHGPDAANRRIDEQVRQRVRAYAESSPAAIQARLGELAREWDIERTVIVQAAATALLGLLLGVLKDRRWFWLTVVNQSFLLQHAIRGWCPPVELHRRLGVRTRQEIDVERIALQALRGDFTAVAAAGSPAERADTALGVAAGDGTI
jgi:hypothetical protein